MCPFASSNRSCAAARDGLVCARMKRAASWLAPVLVLAVVGVALGGRSWWFPVHARLRGKRTIAEVVAGRPGTRVRSRSSGADGLLPGKGLGARERFELEQASTSRFVIR